MAPLGTAAAAAVEGFLRSKRGSRSLRDDVVVALLAFFSSKGISLKDLPTTPPAVKLEHEEWLAEWADYAKDAGLADESDRNNVTRWINSDESFTANGVRAGKAYAVAAALTKKGMTIDRADELAIASALADADAGEMRSQCRSIEVIWIVYTGRSPGDNEREWFTANRQAAQLDEGGEVPTVDIRLCKDYAKQLATTTVTTLERALRDRSGLTWQTYQQTVAERLNTYGYSKAAMMWSKICHFARSQNMGQIQRELK